MARSSFTPVISYTGAGNLATYTFPFKIEAKAQLEVVEFNSAGAETQRVLGTDTSVYISSVTFDAVAGGGTVVLKDNLITGSILKLLLANDAPTQNDEYKNKGDFTQTRIEASLDFQAGSIQRLSYLAKRSLKLNDNVDPDVVDPTLPTVVASTLLGFNSLATGIVTYTIESLKLLAAGVADTDDVLEGAINLYHTAARVNALIDTKLIPIDILTTKGDVYGYSTVNARVPVGTNGKGFVANSNQGLGVAWEEVTSKGELKNLSLAAAVGSSALTISVKDKAGANASTTNPIGVGFRGAPISSGVYNTRTISAALSLVVSSGSTLGHLNATTSFIYVYLIDNAGTPELAVSTRLFSGDGVVTTVAEGGAGGADLAGTMYSTTVRANVAFRLVGRLTSSQSTAGTWASAISQISIKPFEQAGEDIELYLDDGNGHGSTNTRIRRWTDVQKNSLGAHATYVDSAANGMSVTINVPGLYGFEYADSDSAGGENFGVTLNEGATLSTNIIALTHTQGVRMRTSMSTGVEGQLSGVIRLVVNDVIRSHTDGGANNSGVQSYFKMIRIGD